MSFNRTLAPIALACGLVIALVAGPTMAQAATAAPSVVASPSFPRPQSAQQGAAWLASQLVPAGYLPSQTVPGTADLSGTANTVLALAAAGVDPTGANAALGYLAGHVDAYVVSGGVDGPGQLALLILDAHALGEDPYAFGGTDLVSRLLATEQTSGPDQGLFGTDAQAANYEAGNYQQGLALAALDAAGVRGTAQTGSAVTWLVDQQCPGGGWTTPDNANNACNGTPANYAGPDTNATALAVQGLAAQGALTAPVSTAALSFLATGQDADAGWSYYPDSVATPQATDPDSTALVIQALGALGTSPVAPEFQVGGSDPVSALVGFQITAGAGAGAFTFPGIAGPNLLATYQAVPAVAGVALPFVASFVGQGYVAVGADGGVFAYGAATFAGSHGGSPLNAPITGIASTPDGRGYWLAGADGGIFAYGDAAFLGSHGGSPLNARITGIAATPDGRGYWLAGADGGIFAYGDAAFFGSHGGSPLNAPITGIAATPDGRGYWLVGADGGIFAYGDATFLGSHGGSPLNARITGIAATPDGRGYWLVGADGGIFAYGDATFAGSHGGSPLNAPITGITSTPDGRGYWLVGSDGGIYAYGDAAFAGAPSTSSPAAPVVAVESPRSGPTG